MKNWVKGSILAVMLAVGGFAGTAEAGGGEFKFAEEVKLISLDPQQIAGGGISYLQPVYETLLARTPEDGIAPLLATGYEVDGLTVTLTLREDVKFSDGERFDAKAVVASLMRGKEVGILTALKPIEKAEAVDDFTVKITLASPAPSLLSDFTSAPGMIISPKALEDPALDRNPVGTGPYVYNKEESREGEVRVYTPNPDYWDPDMIGLDRVEIWEMPDNTARFNALKTGQVDAGIWLANPQSAIIDKTPGLKLVQNGGGVSYFISILDREGTKVPAFGDVRVRQAIYYAIDRDAYVQAVDFGLSVPAFQPYPKGTWPHEPSLEGRYTYDLVKARALMKEAGYEEGFEFDMPSIPIFQPRLEALQGFLRDINITMNIVPVEPGTLARRSRTTDFPATNLVWNGTRDPHYLTLWATAEDAAFNPFKVKPSETMAKLSKEGVEAVGPEARAPFYRDMAKELADEAYMIFISATPVLFGVREEVVNNPTLKYRPGEDTVYLRGLKMDN